ncbi:hypothetical protein [Prochlorothrix hollandica]|uniref:Uncharacterized protein n=1 Tax=Prochlorothrix hollandica PCC 9006 = CALU 1027 TaxID=317619 RepID=A0A0M2PNL0_PROHO|nr:hypothetical protein [Prochlorothrix hollandica]KKI98200.1 hypothetical protein PROH_21230 [Prochlorothrix hollandica PCC 9006 = CALU 1027]
MPPPAPVHPSSPPDPAPLPEIFQLVRREEVAPSLHYHSTHLDGLHNSGVDDQFESYEGATLMPMRGRDLDALMDLFDRSDIEPIVLNLSQTLEQRLSSEDWEDVAAWRV